MIRVQQDEVYAAERDVRQGMTFTTEADAQAWLDALRETWWWRKFFWKAPARTEVYWREQINPELGLPPLTSVGSYDKDKDAGLIEMLPAHRNELIMLHELAHVIAEALNDSHAHDPFFARTYAVLVYAVLGSEAWLELQRGFDACGVDYMQGAVTS